MVTGPAAHCQNAPPPVAPAAASAPDPVPATEFHDVVHFRNGDRLHGRLYTLTAGAQLEWHAPYYNQLVRFPTETIDNIVFRRTDPALTMPDADKTALLLTNNDLLIGKLVALDNKTLTLAIPYGKPLTIRRTSIKSILPRMTTSGSFYFGPKPADKWEPYNPHSRLWRVEDKKLVSVPGGTAANKIPLGSDCSIQFDASWDQIPSFWIGLGLDDKPDMIAPSVQMIFNGPTLQIRETQRLGNNQQRSNQIGNSTILNYPKQLQARFTLVFASASKSVSLLIDDAEAVKANLTAALPTNAQGIVFGTSGQSQMQIQNIKILNLVADPDPKAKKRAESEKSDLTVLANNDTIPGNILSIQNDLVTVNSPRGDLHFPIDRIRAISLNPNGQERARLRPTDIRLWTENSDLITFSLERIDAQAITGTSDNFGRVAFHRGAFNRIEFQIHDTNHKQPKK
jgi:hypothetical protein